MWTVENAAPKHGAATDGATPPAKRLSAVLAFIREQQEAPRGRDQRDERLFKVYEPRERCSLGKIRPPRRGVCGGRRAGAARRTGSASARRPKLAVSHDLRLSGFTAAERDQCEQLSEPKRRRTAPRATIVVPDADGNERTFRDYLTDTALGAVKLRQACEAAGALRVTKSARSATPIFPGMMCGSKLGARNKRGYPDRNVIEDYATSSASSVVALRGAQ